MLQRGAAQCLAEQPGRVRSWARRGIPAEQRWEVWKALLGAGRRVSVAEYQRLLKQDSEFDRMIQLDGPRTFPALDTFFEQTRQKLERILHAYAVLNPIVGYLQGMNFVCATLLQISGGNEEESFQVLVCLLEDKGVSGFYKPGFPLLRKYQDAFEALLRLTDPDCAQKFAEEPDCGQMIQKWLLALFLEAFARETALVIWDAIVAEDLEVALEAAVSIVAAERHSLQEKPPEEFKMHFQQFKKTAISPEAGREMGRRILEHGQRSPFPDHVRREIASLRTTLALEKAA